MSIRRYDPLVVSGRLKNLRKEKGITQKELSTKTGISLSSIKQYELGKRIPEMWYLGTLAKFFNVPKDYILGIT